MKAPNPRKRADNRTAKRKVAAHLSAAGKSRKETAKAIGVNEHTVTKWQHDDEYKAEFNSVLVEAREAMGRGLALVASEAVQVLRESLMDDDSGVRLRAALEVMDRCGLPAFKAADITTITGGEAVPDTVVRIEIPKGSM